MSIGLSSHSSLSSYRTPGFIGVFDSGVGGLTVVRRIWELMPYETVLFIADQAHVPYGGRPLADIASYAGAISAALVSAGAKAIVMACNISTATALKSVIQRYPEEIVIGVIAPGAVAAVAATVSRSIGVLATAGTVSTLEYTRTLNGLLPGVCVTEVACPDFVPLIEAECTNSNQAILAAKRYLAPIMKAEADVVILGCTHYPFLLPCLRQLAPHIRFIDPAEHAACHLSSQLAARRLNTGSGTMSAHSVYTTGKLDVLTQQISFFLPHAVITESTQIAPEITAQASVVNKGTQPAQATMTKANVVTIRQAVWQGGALCLEPPNH